MLQLIPGTVIILIFISGAFLYKEAFSVETNFRFSREVKGRSFSSWYKKEFINTATENLFRQVGLKIPASFYQLIRYVLLAVWLAYISYLRLHDGKKVTVFLALWLVLLVISKPTRKLLRYKSPFLLVCEQINRKNKAKMNIEIDRCLSQLKNIAKTMSGNALSSDYIIKELSKYTKVTKPYFLRLLGFWYEGRYKEGQEYFSNAIWTEEARELAGIFTKLDYLAHDEFISQLEMYQNQIAAGSSVTAVKVSVKMLERSYSPAWLNRHDANTFNGQMWNQDIRGKRWRGTYATFLFTVTYSNGTVKTDSVRTYIVDDDYWRIRMAF